MIARKLPGCRQHAASGQSSGQLNKCQPTLNNEQGKKERSSSGSGGCRIGNYHRSSAAATVVVVAVVASSSMVVPWRWCSVGGPTSSAPATPMSVRRQTTYYIPGKSGQHCCGPHHPAPRLFFVTPLSLKESAHRAAAAASVPRSLPTAELREPLPAAEHDDMLRWL